MLPPTVRRVGPGSTALARVRPGWRRGRVGPIT